MKIHIARAVVEPGPETWTVCGVYVSKRFMSENRTRATCKQCLRRKVVPA